MKHFAIFISILVLAVVACGGAGAVDEAMQAAVPVGQVWAAQPGTTLYWVNQAFQGARDTWILAKDGAYIVLWSMPGNQGIGFTLIKEAGNSAVVPIVDWMKATGGKGNIANYSDISGFIQYMKDNGWKTSYPGAVSLVLRNGVQAAWEATKIAGSAVVDGFLAAGQNFISIIVLPVGAVPTCDPSVPIELCEFDEYY